MKTVYETEVGGDGGKAGLYVGEGKLKLEASYPLEKALTPLTKVVDDALDKLEGVIPGDQKAFFEKIKAEAKEQLMKLISE